MALIFSTKFFAFLALVVLLLSFSIDSCNSYPYQNKTIAGDATFYDVGLGACGKVNTDDQFICALNFDMFDPSPNGNPNLNKNCGRKVKVTRGNKHVIVTIVDRCAGCKCGDLDLSPAAFCKIANTDEGRVKMTWRYLN
jgi:expansin (peptidoglycan-binding protein)